MSDALLRRCVPALRVWVDKTERAVQRAEDLKMPPNAIHALGADYDKALALQEEVEAALASPASEAEQIAVVRYLVGGGKSTVVCSTLDDGVRALQTWFAHPPASDATCRHADIWVSHYKDGDVKCRSCGLVLNIPEASDAREAERDVARYRWLRENVERGANLVPARDMLLVYQGPDSDHSLRAKELDSIIDAAIAGAKKAVDIDDGQPPREHE